MLFSDQKICYGPKTTIKSVKSKNQKKNCSSAIYLVYVSMSYVPLKKKKEKKKKKNPCLTFT